MTRGLATPPFTRESPRDEQHQRQQQDKDAPLSLNTLNETHSARSVVSVGFNGERFHFKPGLTGKRDD